MKSIAFTCLLLLALSSCKTTGDPTQGGLFGWSRDKADQRLRYYEQEATAAEREASEENAKSKQLSGDLKSKNQELAHERQLVDDLLTENNKLHEQLLALLNSKSEAADKLRELEKDRNELLGQIISQGDMIVDPYQLPNNAPEKLSKLNMRYKEAILFLLK
ncbi:MAG: hypothetical protein MI867_20165 [Pseudomonadales bacterium]|nr:hypothetical protein [Pseudomonadales bacterium]